MIRVFWLFFILILFSPSISRGDIYFYKAPDGVMHFSDTPAHRGFKKISTAPGSRFYLSGEGKREMGLRELYSVITRIARINSMDPDLILAVIKAESDFDSRAVSKKGAKGLMQLMPATAERFWVRDLFDPVENIQGGVLYLKELFQLYDGNMDYSLAAYNAGEGAVFRYRGVPPFKETRRYVKRVKNYYHQMKKGRGIQEPD